MDHFAGLDISVKETSVCILDDAGKIVKEVNVASEPQALLLSALQIVPTPTSYSSASCTMVAPLA
jgi:predicted NBD/HSP70 family sugar kinase